MSVPTKDAELITYSATFTEQIRINQEKWGIREALFNSLRRANNQAQDAWKRHTDSLTAGPASTIVKDDTFELLHTRITLMHDILRGSDDLVSDTDLHLLGVSPRVRPARERRTKPVVATNIIVERLDFYNFSVVSKEQELGGQRTKSIRDMSKHPMIVVRYCYIPIEATLPVDREELDWTTNQAVGHSQTIIDATGKAGLKLVVQSAFHNTAGTGPWSEPFEIIVS